MKNRSLWEVTVNYQSGAECVRRIHSESLMVGSAAKSQIKIARPGPELAFKAERHGAEGAFEISATDGLEIEFKSGEKWIKKTHYKGALIPQIRYNGTTYSIKEIPKEDSSFQFEPVNWAADFENSANDRHALWHFRGDVLIETVLVERRNQKATLKCGYEFHWNAKKSDQIELKEHNGQIHIVALEKGPKGSLKAKHGQDIFFLTGLPKQSNLISIPVSSVTTPENQQWNRLNVGLSIFWFLFFVLLQFVPKENIERPVESIKTESLGSDMVSITVENHKNPGGNGKRGGGGVEHVKTNDVRGGSGRTGTVKTAAPQAHKAAKVARTGTGAAKAPKQSHSKPGASTQAKAHPIQGLAIPAPSTNGMYSAIARLDSGVKHGKYGSGSEAMAGGGKDKIGRDGVLGTLGKMSGTPGGNGLGIGGVGTKGFGGGGGGGKGAGFGTGIGEGLGEGHGPRQISFGNGGTQVRGGLEKSEIDAVVQENMPQIRYCFNKRLRTNPNIQGKVTSAFTIGSNGRVRTSRIKDSSLGTPDVESCIQARVASWLFPKPRGGGEVTASVPFILKAN